MLDALETTNEMQIVGQPSHILLAKLCMITVSIHNHRFKYIPFIAHLIILLYILLIMILNVNIVLAIINKKPNKFCPVFHIVNLFAYDNQGFI